MGVMISLGARRAGRMLVAARGRSHAECAPLRTRFRPGEAVSAIGEMLAIGPSAPFPAVNIAVLLLMAAIALPIAAAHARSQLVQ